MIKRLIFDVDGTLIVGVDFIESVKRTLKRFNIYSEENLENFLKAIKTYETKYNSYNKKDYLNHFGDNLGIKLTDNFLDIFFEELKDCIPSKNEKLINTIKELSEKYEMVLLTNYFGKSQLNRLNNMQIGQYFTEYYGEELIKPNKEIYIKACGKHHPSECVMIGDDLVLDIKGAKEQGLNAIFVNSKNIDIESKDIIKVDKVEEITIDLINNI